MNAYEKQIRKDADGGFEPVGVTDLKPGREYWVGANSEERHPVIFKSRLERDSIIDGYFFPKGTFSIEYSADFTIICKSREGQDIVFAKHDKGTLDTIHPGFDAWYTHPSASTGDPIVIHND